MGSQKYFKHVHEKVKRLLDRFIIAHLRIVSLPADTCSVTCTKTKLAGLCILKFTPLLKEGF